jgi:hypothetical protein
MVAVSAFQRDEIRPIDADDLEAVLAIDRAHTKYSRRRFFRLVSRAAVRSAVLRSSIFCAANSAATIWWPCSMH